uniref:C-X-C motif chemokine n=1 Tax=Nomascus leucogenys TaxID=61853 RepID=G1R8X2_NOMLE
MSLPSSRPARVPGPSRSLCALLALLLLLTPPGPLASAGPVSAVLTELRCTCLHTTLRVNPKMIGKLQVFPAGPQCSKVEVVASLKNGKQICLDPEAPFLKKVIQKILDSGNKKN